MPLQDGDFSFEEQDTKKKKAKRQPWISNTTLELIEERKNLKAGGITQDKKLYKEKSRERKNSLKMDKKHYVEDQCKEMEEMHALHKDCKLFKHARLMTTVLKPAPKAIKDKTGKVRTENIEILGRWREDCSEMYKAEQTPDTTIIDMETEPEPLIDEVRWELKQITMENHQEMMKSGGHLNRLAMENHQDMMKSGGHLNRLAMENHQEMMKSGGHLKRLAMKNHQEMMKSGGYLNRLAMENHQDMMKSGGHLNKLAMENHQDMMKSP